MLGRFRNDALAIEPVERRRDIRHTTVFQVAKLTGEGLEELCILRDVSPGGLKIETYCRLTVDARVTVTLRTEHAMSGRVVWTRDNLAGIAFDHQMPVLAMLAHCSVDDRIGGIRPPRIETRFVTGMRVLGREHQREVRNVSQAGLKIAVPEPMAPQARCGVLLGELGWRDASVRWCRDGEVGVQLLHTLGFEEFARWRLSTITPPRRQWPGVVHP